MRPTSSGGFGVDADTVYALADACLVVDITSPGTASAERMRSTEDVMSVQMNSPERCLTVADAAERLSVDADTVRRLFAEEPGVIVITFPRKGRRQYRTLRIPEAIFRRVVMRLTRVA